MKVYSPDGGSMEADARCLSILLEAGFTKTKPEQKEEVVEEPVAETVAIVDETAKEAPSKKLPAKPKKIRKKT